MLAARYQARPPLARKGTFGRVLVLGGSDVYSGAPTFNALAALRAGADLAVVVAPRRAADLVAGASPDIITVACASTWPDPALAAREMGRADAVVVGGGVERTPGAHDALRVAMRACTKPMVVDAEAVRALHGHGDVLRGKRALLTPHGGEFEAWTGAKPTEAAIRDAARRTGATLLVKGPPLVVTDGTRWHENAFTSPFMTKGGWGDLLAGAAGAFLARGAGAFEAAGAAAELVGRAGSLAAEALGESTLASDGLARFPDAIKAAQKESH